MAATFMTNAVGAQIALLRRRLLDSTPNGATGDVANASADSDLASAFEADAGPWRQNAFTPTGTGAGIPGAADGTGASPAAQGAAAAPQQAALTAAVAAAAAVTPASALAAAAAVTPASALVSAGGMTFNLLWDAAAQAAPAAFRAAIVQAATLLSQAIADKITVDLTIHYAGSGGGASAKPDGGLFEPYATVRSDLIAAETPGDTTFAGLPNAATIQGQGQVAVWNAELKALGLLGANDTTTDDGEATFATDISANLLVGVALHELTHALGRVPFGQPSDASASPDVFDLFRFTGPGTRLFANAIPSASGYFSVDGGATKLADYGLGSDPSDFLNSGVQGPNDPFNEFYSAGTVQALSSVDIEQMDALGFHVVTSSSLTIALKADAGASGSDKLTNDPTLTGLAAPNATVTVKENGATIATTTASAAGVWTVRPTLADGQHAVTASVGSATASLTFVLATGAPTVSASETVSGTTSQTSDTITASATAESVAGNAIAGVEVFDGAADLGAATLSAGSWTFTATNLLPGAHTFVAKATDRAGNAATAALAKVTVTGSGPTSAYTLADIGFTGTGVTDIRPKGINGSGEIVGYYLDSRADDLGADGLIYTEHGFESTVSGGVRQYVSIDDPDGPIDSAGGETSGPDRTRAYGVNDKGDIVGWYAQDEFGTASDGTPYILPDAGFIMASSWPNTFGKLGFSALNDLGTHAIGINSGDDIVGWYADGSGVSHGFYRKFTGYGVRGDYTPFDPPNSVSTTPEGINDSGQIVGYYETSDAVFHGFTYNPATGVFTTIDVNGAADTNVLGVNNAGVMVGDYIDATGRQRGFVRSAAGQVTTIDDPNAGTGATLVSGINNAGEIVGWYHGSDGRDHGFTGVSAAAAPTISGAVAGQTTSLEKVVKPFAGVVVTDPNAGATDTLTISLAGGGGTLSGAGLVANGAGGYTLTGSAATVTSELAALTFTPKAAWPKAQVTTTFTLSDASSAFATPAVDATTTVIDTDPTGSIALSAAYLAANIDGVNAAKGVTGITLTDPPIPKLALTAAQAAADKTAIGAIVNPVFEVVAPGRPNAYGFNNGSATIGGGNTVVTFFRGPSNSASLVGTGGAWDTVTAAGGAKGTVYLTSAGANVYGGGESISFWNGKGNAASLIGTGGAWDWVSNANGAVGTIYLSSAGANVIGGGDTVTFWGGTGDAASLIGTGGAWDTVTSANGAKGTVYLTSAGANVYGGGDTIAFWGGTGDAASLIGTGSAWDTVTSANGAKGKVYLTSAGANIYGGGDTVTFWNGTGDAASLINTGGVADTVASANGAKGTVYLTNAQAAISGGGDTVDFWGGTGNKAILAGTGYALVFNAAKFGLDTVTGWTAGDTLTFSAADKGLLTVSQSGLDTKITLDANDVVTLTNVSAATLAPFAWHA